MSTSILLVFIIVMLVAIYALGYGRSMSLAKTVGGVPGLNSLPFYYGMLTVLWSAIPAALLLGVWLIFQADIIEMLVVQQLPEDIRGLEKDEINLILNKIYNVAYGQYVGDTPPFVIASAEFILGLERNSQWLVSIVVLLSMAIIAAIIWLKIHPKMKARVRVEAIFKNMLLACACIAILTTIGIVFSVLFESLRFFQQVSVFEFLFGLEWAPQAHDGEQVPGKNSGFGALPLFAGTLLIASIAMLIAVPTGLMSAIYLSEYAPRRARAIIKPLLEVLAGIPTVVYGFIAALTVAPFIRDVAIVLGLDSVVRVSSDSALAAGLVMGVMIIPFISSLSDDVINAVPQSLRDGALALGATTSEVVKLVVIPAALPGIVGSILLAVSRAIGETMIVMMAAGLAAKITANPLDSVTTVTVQIVTLLVGDQEFDSPKTLAAFALGLVLFIVTLSLNYISLHVVKKYREHYE
ncbi:phosphate ABC transporter permease subunit PstC [Agarilytica rhodophyticola]|uniref:phosphate ABC transporter permease subunit PstC n=1 Tax=Agarilytica rhodophyticola TaxID=1737490 RepID=UPI000B3478E9|nr:phosphate ABC transporter permease subunit PstC [Agarilytica rhodophyticola]